MKKAFLFVALGAVAVTGCDKIKDLAKFQKDFSYTETVDIPEINGLPPATDTFPPQGVNAAFPAVGFATNSKDYVKDAGSAAELVEHVKLKAFSAAIKEPADKKFDFMDTIRLYVSAKGLDEKMVAYKYGIPVGTQKIEFTCEDVDLKDYFLKDTMYLRLGGHFRSLPDSAASTMELSSTFNMLANPLK